MRDVMAMQPVTKDLLYIKIADAIHKYISDNHLTAGEKLPSERVLAAQLTTGRNSVREALRVLEHEGIIDVKPGRGAFVGQGTNPNSLYLKLFRVNYFELLEIKTLLELEVIKQATREATSHDLMELDDILHIVERSAAKGIYDESADRRFHQTMLKLSSNRTIEQMVTNLIEALSNYGMLIKGAEQIFISTIPYHRMMLEAIKRGDADAACKAFMTIKRIDMKALDSTQNT